MEIVVKRKLTVGGLIGHLASVAHFHSIVRFDPKIYLYMILIPHAISVWNIIPGSLLPLFNVTGKQRPVRSEAASAPSLS